jgi:preprotein translocase subunit SecA
MFSIFRRALDYNLREITRIRGILAQVNLHEPEVRKLSDEDFPHQTLRLKEEVASGKTLNQVLPYAFALAREAASRSIKMRHFDTQVIAAVALHEGKIAEQKTGEGKTLTATLALYLNALTGKGVHLVTVNDYLARRDAGWMGKVFHFLGLTTSAIISDQSFIYDPEHHDDSHGDERLSHLRPTTRKAAYEADITYGVNSEFGFDYLRDNMASSPEQLVQRGFHFAIVDEADSVLIDEARTPHIISEPVERDVSKYYEYARIVRRLDPTTDYVIDEKLRTANLTDKGISKIEGWLGVSNLYEKDYETLFHLEAALKAQTLFKRDKEYIVANDEVVIVDEFTGRLLEGRRFSEGLHQAIEAKENVPIKRESRTLATVSLQNYFRMYTKLAGMTGTAATESEEFHKIYKTDVLVIPTHRPMIRKDLPDMIYKTERAKFNAVADEVARRHATGQPVLVGTTSIEKNEYLSSLLRKRGIEHELLNAKNHEREAIIIAKAGMKGAVTVATNMAGRGVDILLGGLDGAAHDEVAALGGLAVIGTERHESRRIDNQLRGRSGRQGDPGTSQFFVSLQDDMIRIFGGDQISRLMTFFNFPEQQPLSHPMVNRALESAQTKVEGHNFDIRKHLVQYDDVLNKQREIVYGLRRKMLFALVENEDVVNEVIETKIRSVIVGMIAGAAAIDEMGNEKGKEVIAREIVNIFGIDGEKVRGILDDKDEKRVEDELFALAASELTKKTESLPDEVWRHGVRAVFLSTIDQYWTMHLTSIEDLREGINLRGFGQMDPLVEYKNEAFRLFEQLVHDIDYEVVKRLFSVQYHAFEAMTLRQDDRERQMILKAAGVVDPYQSTSHKAQSNRPHTMGQPQIRRETDLAPSRSHLTNQYKDVGRNDPCPCGAINESTGRPYKYKNCGLINAPHHKKG